MSTEQIVAMAGKYAAVILGALGGFAGLVSIVKLVIRFFIQKKPMKLTTDTSEAIAERAADMVTQKLANGVAVDMSAQIDAATNKRLSELEKKNNELIDDLRQAKKRDKLLMASIADFKTITNENRVALMKAVAEDEKLPEKTDIPVVTAFVEKVKDNLTKNNEAY